MTLNPQVLVQAQAEIDSVVGSERLPDFKDRPRLSYGVPLSILIAEKDY